MTIAAKFHRLVVLPILLVFTFASCSSTAQQKPKPVIEDDGIDTLSCDLLDHIPTSYCDAFQLFLNLAYDIHYRYQTRNELGDLPLKSAINKVLNVYGTTEEVDGVAAGKKALEELRAGKCETLYSFYRELPDRQDPLPQSGDAKNLEVISIALDAALKTLDPHSYYHKGSEPATQGFGLTTWHSKAQKYLLRLNWLAEKRYPKAQEFFDAFLASVTFPDFMMVADITPLSPADLAGLEHGDQIIAVDGKEITAESHLKLWQKLSDGPKTLDIRDQQGDERTVILNYVDDDDEVPIKTTFDRDGTLYIKLNRFTKEGATELAEKLREYATDQTPHGFVLDLRGNPGGNLQTATDILSLLLQKNDKATCVEVRQKTNKQTEELRIAGGCIRGEMERLLPEETPMIVMVDEQSASASDLTALALKVARRAVVVGSRSFGKGTGQIVRDLPDCTLIGGTYAVTTFIYRVYGKYSPQGSGVSADLDLYATDPRLVKMRQAIREVYPSTRFFESDFGESVIPVNESPEIKPPQGMEENESRLLALLAQFEAQQLPKLQDSCNRDKRDCELDWSFELMKQLIAKTENDELIWSPDAPQP